MNDVALVKSILGDNRIDVVMHFAACALVGESCANPAKYYQNNVVNTLLMLEAMRETDVRKLVFSSTCATYGIPSKVPISETTEQKPVNPYGFTKLVIERALRDYSLAHNFGYAALRYFNAAGASPLGGIGEDHSPESHLIPIVLQAALGQRDNVTVFGSDWPTSDGSCVRDYIHVDDLADAHLRAMERLKHGKGIELNLGTGTGFSVRQIIETCREITGIDIASVDGDRRDGDPPELVADASKAFEVLGWQPKYTSPSKIIQTAWNWHSKNPQGYRESSLTEKSSG